MKYRIVEIKNKEGNIRYKIQHRFLNILWWRDLKIPMVSLYFPPFSEIFECALSHRKYDYSKDKKYRRLYYFTTEFYSIEEAEEELERSLTKYEYKGIRIYPALYDKFYVLAWGYPEKFDIFGSYEDCCKGIDNKLALIEEKEKKYAEYKAKKTRQKEYKKHKNVIKSIDK